MQSARLTAALIVAAITTACAPVSTPQPAGGNAQAARCDQINTLVAADANGFAVIRGANTQNRFGAAWNATQQLLGRDCQVWGSDTDGYSYVCTQSAPNQQVAMKYYAMARDFTAKCLGRQWNLLESVGQVDHAHDAVFSQPDSSTVITIRATPNRGAVKSQWSAYYFIGDRSRLE